MKPQLQRITNTLEKLNQEYPSPKIKPAVVISTNNNLTPPQEKSLHLSLPKVKAIPLSNHRNATNPALARNILQEIDKKMAQWQEKLTNLQQEIQQLYLEGPIVDGWLESQGKVLSTSKENCQVSTANYRLCGLNQDGKKWSRFCPPEQVAELSMAIARYHKLKGLLYEKKKLETRLEQIAETLAMLHFSMGN